MYTLATMMLPVLREDEDGILVNCQGHRLYMRKPLRSPRWQRVIEEGKLVGLRIQYE